MDVWRFDFTKVRLFWLNYEIILIFGIIEEPIYVKALKVINYKDGGLSTVKEIFFPGMKKRTLLPGNGLGLT